MKQIFYYIVEFMLFFMGLFLYSCGTDDMNTEEYKENGGKNNPIIIKPLVEETALGLVGSWVGQGPYKVAGGNPNKAGLVVGTWEFYNDSTYSWIGYNTYGYKYAENGKWHYNAENKMLVTDSPCSFNWKIEEVLEGQWIGTLLNNKGGTYTYTRQKNKDTSISVCDVRVIDYKSQNL